MSMKPRHAAALALIIAFYCSLVGVCIYIGFTDWAVNPEHAVMFFALAGAAPVEGIRKTVQKWRLWSGEMTPPVSR